MSFVHALSITSLASLEAAARRFVAAAEAKHSPGGDTAYVAAGQVLVEAVVTHLGVSALSRLFSA